MAIFLADIALQHYIPHTLGWLGEAIGSFEDVPTFTDWAVVGETAVSTACSAVVEGVEFLIVGDHEIVETPTIHCDGFNRWPQLVRKFSGEGAIGIDQDVDSLVAKSITEDAKILWNSHFFYLGLISADSLL